jgi:hypothetical protein
MTLTDEEIEKMAREWKNKAIKDKAMFTVYTA